MSEEATSAESSSAQSFYTTASSLGLIALVALWFVLVYLNHIPREGPVFTPWLTYLSISHFPFDRILSGGVWLCVLVELSAGDLAKKLDEQHPLARPLASGLFAAALCYVFRDTKFVLGDSDSLLEHPREAVRTGAYYTFFDELVGLWLPLRIARMRFLSGLDPVAAIVDGYRIVSIAFGAVYAAAVARAAVSFSHPRVLALLLFGSASMLLFAGYIENYAGAYALLAFAFLETASTLRQGLAPKRSIFRATVLCCAAVIFHCVSVWSLPGLIVLAARSEEAGTPFQRFKRASLYGMSIALPILGIVALLFYFWITPGVQWVHLRYYIDEQHRILYPFARGPSDLSRIRPLKDHALQLLRIGTPAFTVLFACFVAAPKHVARLRFAYDVQFALAWLSGFLFHQLWWRSTIGIFRDWDLFSFSSLPLAYLAARALGTLRLTRLHYVALLCLCLFGGMSWMLAQTDAPLSLRERTERRWIR